MRRTSGTLISYIITHERTFTNKILRRWYIQNNFKITATQRYINMDDNLISYESEEKSILKCQNNSFQIRKMEQIKTKTFLLFCHFHLILCSMFILFFPSIIFMLSSQDFSIQYESDNFCVSVNILNLWCLCGIEMKSDEFIYLSLLITQKSILALAVNCSSSEPPGTIWQDTLEEKPMNKPLYHLAREGKTNKQKNQHLKI